MGKRLEVPIWEKTTLTLDEAAALTNIGVKRLTDLTNEQTDLIVWAGNKRLIKRRLLDKYIEEAYSV